MSALTLLFLTFVILCNIIIVSADNSACLSDNKENNLNENAQFQSCTTIQKNDVVKNVSSPLLTIFRIEIIKPFGKY